MTTLCDYCFGRPGLRPWPAVFHRDAAPSGASAVSLRPDQAHGEYVGSGGPQFGGRRHRAGQPRGHAYRRAVPFLVRRHAARGRGGGGGAIVRAAGCEQYSIDTVAPILRRGVLLDIAAGGRRAAGRGFRDHAGASGGRRARKVEIRRRRRGAAAHRVGALLGAIAGKFVARCAARSGAGGGAVAERAGDIRGGLGHGGVRESRRTATCRCTCTCWWRAASTSSSA